MASERLRELQEMEQRIQQGTDNDEIQPIPKEVNLGAGSFRVADAGEAEAEERKSLLRRKLAAQEQAKSDLGSWKIWATVGVTVLSCIALLWALFAGGMPDKYEGPGKCVTGSELLRQAEAGVRFDACPDERWLPIDCLDGTRTRSRTAMEQCNKRFQECEYSLQLLKECGLLS